MKIAKMDAQRTVTLFADGACIPNPGPGGWAFRLQINNIAAEMFGSETESTNLRMELMAVVSGLRHLKKSCHVVLVSDSDYICDGLTRWLSKWKQHEWKTSAGDPVKNLDLWMELDRLVTTHRVNARRPESPREFLLNARVDELANRAAVAKASNDLTYLNE